MSLIGKKGKDHTSFFMNKKKYELNTPLLEVFYHL